ncbi:ATP/GTP-binding protein [Agrococcus casei]|nr:ATP/GTP-binding protein [Agrococcus casei]
MRSKQRAAAVQSAPAPAEETAQPVSAETGKQQRRNRRIERAARRLGLDKGPTAEELAAGEQAPDSYPGARLIADYRKARRGWYGPIANGAPSTTRQAEVLNTGIVAASTGAEGIVNGRDMLSERLVAHDGVTGYRATPRLVTSTNVVRMGDVGMGKSSASKTIDGLRPLILDGRRVVVLDKKQQGEQGEYARLCRAFGTEPITFTNDLGGTRINLLDPSFAGMQMDAPSDAARPRASAHFALLSNALRLQLGRDLSAFDEESLRSALRRASAAERGRALVVADVLPELGNVADYAKNLEPAGRDALHLAGIELRFALTTLLDSYYGLLDGETSKNVELAGRLTSWDISQLPDDGPAIPVVSSMAYMWLLGRLRRERGWQTTLIWEEGWHAVGGPTASIIRSSTKLSRALGLSNVMNIHKGTDIPSDSPGYALVQEAQTVYIHGLQESAAINWTVNTFNLQPGTADTIRRLKPGEFVLKVAGQPEIHVKHERSELEMQLTDTDEGFQPL